MNKDNFVQIAKEKESDTVFYLLDYSEPTYISEEIKNAYFFYLENLHLVNPTFKQMPIKINGRPVNAFVANLINDEFELASPTTE